MKISYAAFLSVASLFTFTACAGTPPPAAAPETTTSEHMHGHAHAHAGVAPALHDFHEVMSPVWHTPEGSARAEKACMNAKSLREKASGAADAELVAAAAALELACAKEGRPDVEAKLAVLHNRFHVLSDKREEKREEKRDEKHEH